MKKSKYRNAAPVVMIDGVAQPGNPTGGRAPGETAEQQRLRGANYVQSNPRPTACTPTAADIAAVAESDHAKNVDRYDRNIASQVAEAISVQPNAPRFDPDSGASIPRVSPTDSLASLVASAMRTGPR